MNYKNLISKYTTGVRKVNKINYLLLTLFLGGFGVHKFYSGDDENGIKYFLFCWSLVPFIASLIEFVIVIQIKADEEGYIYINDDFIKMCNMIKENQINNDTDLIEEKEMKEFIDSEINLTLDNFDEENKIPVKINGHYINIQPYDFDANDKMYEIFYKYWNLLIDEKNIKYYYEISLKDCSLHLNSYIKEIKINNKENITDNIKYYSMYSEIEKQYVILKKIKNSIKNIYICNYKLSELEINLIYNQLETLIYKYPGLDLINELTESVNEKAKNKFTISYSLYNNEINIELKKNTYILNKDLEDIFKCKFKNNEAHKSKLAGNIIILSDNDLIKEIDIKYETNICVSDLREIEKFLPQIIKKIKNKSRMLNKYKDYKIDDGYRFALNDKFNELEIQELITVAEEKINDKNKYKKDKDDVLTFIDMNLAKEIFPVNYELIQDKVSELYIIKKLAKSKTTNDFMEYKWKENCIYCKLNDDYSNYEEEYNEDNLNWEKGTDIYECYDIKNLTKVKRFVQKAQKRENHYQKRRYWKDEDGNSHWK